MTVASSRTRRVLRMETLETRSLLSAAPLPAGAPPVAAGDTVVPIHAQVGSTALETILGVAAKLDTIEQALNAYLNEIPGWHLTGGIDKTPSYSGIVDGNVVIGSNGMLKSAQVALTGSADIAATIEGYYGVSVLHVGLGAAADLSANVSATASFSVDTNAWYYGGSASLAGYVSGYAAAMAWPLKGEVYIRGDVQAAAAIDSQSGIASASVKLAGSVGADAQLKSLFGGWTTIASASRSLGSWQYCASFDVGAWMQSEVNSVVVVQRAKSVSAALAAQPAASRAEGGARSSPVEAVDVQGYQAATAAIQPVAGVVSRTALPSQTTATSLSVATTTTSGGATTDAAVAALGAGAMQETLFANPLAEGYGIAA